MSTLSESELILNSDGSIYHLNLKPDEIADTIITVGDPDRVIQISKYLDKVHLEKQRREFKTITGSIGKKDITIISTGIGTDNIDIVFNELDALVNVDLKTRRIRSELKQLQFFRIGTSGAIDPKIPVDTLLVSAHAIGLDGLMQFYEFAFDVHFEDFKKNQEIIENCYFSSGEPSLVNAFLAHGYRAGITVTAAGFYGPQNRVIRLPSKMKKILDKLKQYRRNELLLTNLEMETAGIYGLGKMLGHSCISLNAILANRAQGTFSNTPKKTVENLIEKSMEVILKV